MARKLKYPELAMLGEGTSVSISGAKASEVRRYASLYGARHNKRFTVASERDGVMLTREPVTDSELPGA